MQISSLITMVIVVLLAARSIRRTATHAQGMSASNRHLFNVITVVVSLIWGAVIGLIVGLFASAVLANAAVGAITGLVMGAVAVIVARLRKKS